jgi:hypothetical protein
MLTESEIKEIEDRLYSMSWEELQETLMHVEMLAAMKANKIVFSEFDKVQ